MAEGCFEIKAIKPVTFKIDGCEAHAAIIQQWGSYSVSRKFT